MAQNRPSGIFMTNPQTNENKELSMKELNEFIKHKVEENKFYTINYNNCLMKIIY